MLISILGMSSAAHANVFKFIFRQAISSTFRDSLRFVPISTQRSRNALSKHTETTGSQVGSRFLSKASATRDCQKILVLSCSRALSTADDFFFFLGETSAEGFFALIPQRSILARFYDPPRCFRFREGFRIWDTCGTLTGLLALNSAMEFI